MAGGRADEPVERTAEVGFRPLRRSDFASLQRWLSAPHVSRWFGPPPDADGVEKEYGSAVEEKYGPRVDGDSPTDVFVIECSGADIGMIQRYRCRDYPDWSRAVVADDAAGIDYCIGEAAWCGCGVGSRAIAAMAELTLRQWPDVARVIAAPQQANEASWRALARAGFTRAWSGLLDSDDPMDAGPAFVYERRRGPETAR